MKNELIEYLASILEHSLNTIKEATDDPVGNPGDYKHFCDMVSKVDYSGNDDDGLPGPSAAEYSDPVLGAYYLTRYGYVYAFEYWVIYDALLRSLESTVPVLCVTTIGCGTMLDAWSLAYAKARILENKENKDFPDNLGLLYFGYDGAKWALYFAGKEAYSPSPLVNAEQQIVNQNFTLTVTNGGRIIPWINGFDAHGKGIDIANIFDVYGEQISYCNVLFFSRILNEISDDKLALVVENIRKAAINGKFKQNELYICISHSPTNLKADIAERIINAINYDNHFTVIRGSILEESPLFKQEALIRESNDTNDEAYKLYKFAVKDGDYGPYGEKPGMLNSDFNKQYLTNIMASIDNFDSRMIDNGVPKYKKRMRRIQYSKMQVIKLTHISHIGKELL